MATAACLRECNRLAEDADPRCFASDLDRAACTTASYSKRPYAGSGSCNKQCCKLGCRDAVQAGSACDVTVAYAILCRESLPLWHAWKGYFETCPAGSVLPVVHTQAEGDARTLLADNVAKYGGADPRCLCMSLLYPCP